VRALSTQSGEAVSGEDSWAVPLSLMKVGPREAVIAGRRTILNERKIVRVGTCNGVVVRMGKRNFPKWVRDLFDTIHEDKTWEF